MHRKKSLEDHYTHNRLPLGDHKSMAKLSEPQAEFAPSAKKMPLWPRRRSPKLSPDHGILQTLPSPAPPPPSRGVNKLTRIMRDIKSKRESVPAHRDIVVEFMGSSPVGRFPVFPVSPGSPPSSELSSLSKLSAQSLQSSSSPISPPLASCIPGQVSAAEQVPTEGKRQKTRFVAAKHLRQFLMNRRCRQGAKLTMLAMLVLGFLCTGKATALGITVAAFVLLRLGLSLGFLDLSSLKPASKPPFATRSNSEYDLPVCEAMKNVLHDQQGKENRNQEKPTSPCHQERHKPVSKEFKIDSQTASEEFKISRNIKTRPYQRSLPAPVPRKAFSPLINSVPSSPASLNSVSGAAKAGITSPSLPRLRSLGELMQEEPPLSPYSGVGDSSAAPHRDPILKSEEHPRQNRNLDPGQEISVLCSRLGPSKRKEIFFGQFQLATAFLVALGGLLHGRVTSVLAVSCWLLLISKLQGLVGTWKAPIQVVKETMHSFPSLEERLQLFSTCKKPRIGRTKGGDDRHGFFGVKSGIDPNSRVGLIQFSED